MRKHTIGALIASLILAVSVAAHAADDDKATAGAAGKDAKAAKKDEKPSPPEKTSVSHGSVDVGGKRIGYTATAGTLLIEGDKDDKPNASVFYVAYTAERGREQLTRHGLEEYVSDCVILLDHRVNDQIATRHLRVVKYRGALHGTNEFPFLIGDEGISVLPITSLGLNHKVSSERVSTGIPRLDAMLGGRGYFRGSSILLTGTPGTGKTSVAACFAQAAARRGERVLFFSFEESPNQIIRNMHSIGLRLEPYVKRGLLRFHAARPTLCGLEMHLATMFKEIAAFRPGVVIVDPITSLLTAGTDYETKGMVTRLIDYLKGGQVTSLFTSLTHGGHALEQSEIAMSSLMDSWLLLQDFEGNG